MGWPYPRPGHAQHTRRPRPRPPPHRPDRARPRCSAQDCRGRRCLEPHAVTAVETAPVSWSLRITLLVLLVIFAAEVWVLCKRPGSATLPPGPEMCHLARGVEGADDVG